MWQIPEKHMNIGNIGASRSTHLRTIAIKA